MDRITIDDRTVFRELDVVLGANYSDPGTVRLFQAGVVQWVLDNSNLAMAKNPDLRLGARSWPPDAREYGRIVDGLVGPSTRRAAAFVNKYLVSKQPNDYGDAITDETLAALPRVTSVPKASAADSAEMRRRTAQAAAEQARTAQTPSEVQASAAKVTEAARESPPEVQTQVAQAAAQAQAARTPAEVREAATKLQTAADQVVASPGGGSLLDTLKQSYGPFPMWGWLLLVGTTVGALVYLNYRDTR